MKKEYTTSNSKQQILNDFALPAVLSAGQRKWLCFRAWHRRNCFIVHILKAEEWDVTIQNNEPPGVPRAPGKLYSHISWLAQSAAAHNRGPTSTLSINAGAVRRTPPHLRVVVK